MVSVRCSGSETNLLDCYYRQPFQYSDCGHSYDAGLSCEASCQNGTVRIVSESDSYFRRYGRVEVCISNEWGTICNDYWNDMAATVVCKMLGYSPYGAKALSNTFTEGYLHMHFTKLNCSGSEESIFNCSYNELSNYYCSRYRDASVICQLNNVQYSNCTTGNIRLTGGSNQFEGRVELCVNGVWGSVCDNSWDSTEASTVCKQLGYEVSSYKTNSFFGVSTLPMHIYYSSCSSSSTNLLGCYLSWLPSYSSYCNNYHEAGVICSSNCNNGQVRLYGSDSQRRGNVQVCINNTWQAVCGRRNYGVDNNLASVVCSELGYSQYGAKSTAGLWYNYNNLYSFFNIHCYGNESTIFDCQYGTSGYCNRYNAIGVVCSHSNINPVNCTDGSIRLYGGSSALDGILHVCANGAWGTVCSRSWL
ncbi:PREDICTED: scavenger receptor cysteine-rich domain superfamily protein-like [Amphimedon queenslandica]|uniref:SRCR domain-containing protein n=1 Tax=Amphimedon queenslandica TaxID=400682 RepID=A0AAN0JEE3_AMPQE|nr:PREDICTED: scavenger receptor cysteine-rich domain superfamily protein-like [Amphimedon queenslandica]|eukprot:XP_019855132.1 PREDICTED: scavenger receptor cysteine-rich domain superfamily protein-like [Amphimedon queenslandica]